MPITRNVYISFNLVGYLCVGSMSEARGNACQYSDVLDYICKLRHQIFMSARVLAVMLRLRRKQVDYHAI